ncbi:MAG: M15 family metallopeptidase [Deltaproteobacteria bacterium]|nr:M15 family metallopeptidase [Deltaproteobacteria bacterium]
MASRRLEDLVEEMREKAEDIQKSCMEKGGFDLLIYCTLRSPEEQARLYRQSRSRQEIDRKIKTLHSRGFDFLGQVLEDVGPCHGPKVTNAGPGESWHNYGRAFDAVPLVGGKPAWDYRKSRSLWDTYGEVVRQAGLYWAGDWTRFREYPHAQLMSGNNPLKEMPADQVYVALLGGERAISDDIAFV